MWWIKHCWRHRPFYISTSLVFIVPSIPLFLQEGKMSGAIGAIFLAMGIIILILVFSIPSRNAIPPPEKAYKESQIIWGLWHTGDLMMELGIVEKYHSKIKRLLLLEPSSPAFRENMERTIGDKTNARQQIIRLTKLAKAKKIKVKWYNKLQHNGITLYDPIEGVEPNSDKAWCVMQELKPNVPRELRPMAKLLKKDSQFRDVLNNYKDIWENHSREPEPREYEDITHATA